MNYKYFLIIFFILLIIIFINTYYFNNKICLTTFNNNYDGYYLKNKNEVIDNIDLNEITPRDFFEKYVIKRKPVIFNTTIKGKFNKWNNNYLKKIIGNEIVYAEIKNGIYSRGDIENMRFNDFINYIENGNNKYYLNVQPNKKNEKYLISPLLKKLYKLNELPIIPPILGNIIPVQINIWMGANNTKSKLHHDYHDNLYIVIKGKKIIKLYSPNDAYNLHTKGCISKINKNGLIEYNNLIGEHNHFSKIDIDNKKSEVYKRYNKFINAKETICEINEGEMIFIPCGWFHQVTSLNNALTNENHIAISYWCHSPDLLNKESFDYPYNNKYLNYYFNNQLKNI